MPQIKLKPNWLTALFSRNKSQDSDSSHARFGVSFKLIAVVVTILVAIAGIQILVSSQATRQNIVRESEDVLVSYYVAYQTKVKAESQAAESLALSIANRADVHDLYLNGNREELYDLLSPLFSQWKDRQIVHLYIENPDGTVFLRVHNPEKFGDDITYRDTAKTALLEKRVTSGVEIGPSRLGVRGVAPMYSSGGQFIGLTEVGVDFDEKFLADLKESVGTDFTMWVTYEAAAEPNLKPAEDAPGSPMEELFYYASTNPVTPLVDIDTYRSVLETGKPAFQIITENTSTPSIVYITPLLGYNNKVLGLLQITESYAEHIEAQNTAFFSTLGVTSGLTIVGLLLIWVFASRNILQPLKILSQFASRQMTGETSARVSISSGDEFQELAETFNALASSVELERQTLEQHVADRTKDLATVAEVGIVTATILESKRLLQGVVDLTKERFNLYHSHIYLFDEEGKNLILTAGAGETGRVMVAEKRSIPLNREQSLVARAARERKGVTVNDVTQAPDFLPNPLLPDTRSELAVPMIVGGNVIGVFDIQSEQVGRFTDADVNIQTTLAAQVATSIQNVRSFEKAKTQAELESLVNAIGQKIQRTTTIEETLQTAIREIGTAIGASRVHATIGPVRSNGGNPASRNQSGQSFEE